jgi:ubiquitin carboxyl-terminal hydrolase 5/13
VILPDYVTLPFPSVELPEKVHCCHYIFVLVFNFNNILPSRGSLTVTKTIFLILQVRLAVDAIIMAEGAERKEQLAAWIAADKKQVSAYAMSLPQIDNGVVIPPSRWKCAKCDKKDNLWLNLTDGMILCGRKNWDGTGGNNHAIEHYKETSYPLAVKLGTITADLEAAGNANLHCEGVGMIFFT